MERVKVTRHTILFRMLHWLIFAEAITLGVTGLRLADIWLIEALPRGIARAIHVVIGLAWVFTALFFVYYFIISGEYRWYGLRRIPYSIDFLIAEIKAWFGLGPRVEEPIKYDAEKGEYTEKIVPTEVLSWWIWVIIGLAIALTGLALLYPEQFAFVHAMSRAVITDYGGNPYAAARIAHLLTTFLAVAFAILHAYAAWVFRMLRSITFGDRDEPVA